LRQCASPDVLGERHHVALCLGSQNARDVVRCAENEVTEPVETFEVVVR